MKPDNLKVAAILTSPLQILLAKRICDKFAYKDVVYHILVSKDDVRKNNLRDLSELWGLNYTIHYFSDAEFSGVYKYFKLLKSLGNSTGCDKAIIGMYSNITSHLLAINFLKNKGELFYIDDGTATFDIPNEQVYSYRKKSQIWKFVSMMLNLKKVKHDRFLTIFDKIETKHYTIEHINPFENSDSGLKQSGIYVLGTNADVYVQNFKPMLQVSDFNDFMIRVFGWIKEYYPNEPIYYSPHGRDNSHELIDYCLQNEISVVRSKYSVEIDYINNNFNPKAIIGPSSTALYTLKKIYPQAEVYDAIVEGANPIFPQRIESEKKEKNAQGIKTLII